MRRIKIKRIKPTYKKNYHGVEVKKVEGIRISIPKKLPGRRFIGFESISRIVSKYIKPEDEERVEQEIRELLKKEGYTRF